MSSFTKLIDSTVSSNACKTFATWYNDTGKAVDEYTFSDLWEEAGVIAHHLRIKWKLKKGDRIVLCYSSGLQFFASFMGCIRAGITAVLVYPPSMPLTKSLPKMAKVVSDCNAKLIIVDPNIQLLRITDRTNFASKSRHLWPKNTAFKVHNFKHSDISFDDTSISESELAFLQYTSGSTDSPYEYGTLDSNVREIIASMFQTPHNIDISNNATKVR